MKVILKEELKNLGQAGDIKEVKKGYADNYLLPRGLALAATPANMKVWESEKRSREKKKEKDLLDLKGLAEKLSGLSCNITVQAGEDDKLYGSVTSADIADALVGLGVTLDKRKIVLDEPLKQIGVFNVPVHLGPGIETSLKVWVMKQ
jgi:large subunit ribosomal protein L9